MLKFLISSEQFSNINKDDLTYAHMDVNSVSEGSIVISPVKVDGGRIYIGNVHSIQGNGELAMHTIDVTAQVLVQAKLIKNLNLDGPIVLSTIDEIDYRFKSFTSSEYEVANTILKPFNISLNEKFYPLQFVGSGQDLNEAIDNAVNRASLLTNMNKEEVMNRATIFGKVEIGRVTGLVYITIMLPESILKNINLLDIIKNQYK